VDGENAKKAIREELERIGIPDCESKAARIEEYLVRVKQRRRWAGLVSRSVAGNPEAAVLESIGMISAIPAGEAKDIVEIGSGGGLLGLVLATACPGWSVTMVESSGRKCAFVAEAVGALGLPNAVVLNARAEELVGLAYFDVAVSRAAGRLREVAPLALGLLREGGRYVALKGSETDAEIEEARAALREAGGRLAGVIHPGLSTAGGPAAGLSLVVIEKM